MATIPEIKTERGGFCRICQCYEDGDLFDMLDCFKEVTGSDEDVQPTCEAFTRITGIKVSAEDDLSRFVCGDCFTRLRDFLLLRQEAEDSRRTKRFERNNFESSLGQTIKWECEETQPQCLICMGYDDEMTDIFSGITFELDVDYVEMLSHIFEEIVGISPSDYEKGNKLLCGGCVNRVKQSSLLRYQASRCDTASAEEPSSAAYLVDIKQENFNCQICLKAFANQLEYESHMPCSSKTTTERSFKCPICEKSFARLYTVKIHMLAHSNERSYECNICSKTFKYPNSLNCHVRTHSEDRPFSCEVCSKTFKRSDTLAKHSITHNAENNFFCDICSKGFKYASYLRTHLQIHTDQRPFGCEICGKLFRKSSAVSDHMLVHQDQKPHVCHLCSKTFKYARTLKKHIRFHDSEERYTCELCPKSFKHSYNLTAHVRTHGISYNCTNCSKSFISESGLKKHLKVHSKDRPFSCDICPKTFKSSSKLTLHQKTHNPKEI